MRKCHGHKIKDRTHSGHVPFSDSVMVFLPKIPSVVETDLPTDLTMVGHLGRVPLAFAVIQQDSDL